MSLENVKHDLVQAISHYVDPLSGQNFGSLKAIKEIQVSDQSVEVSLCMPYAMQTQQDALREQLLEVCEEQIKARYFNLTLDVEIAPSTANETAQSIPGVKNIIAIASGKGGVGKSSTAVNLALALMQEGARVGMLDADIYGPSLPLMLGVAESTRPAIVDDKYFVPVESHGLQMMSMGLMTSEKTPMVWRGPMASGALMQMFNQTQWNEVDYLIVDMPPGTGDIQLTLAQQIPCTGSVVVTTPQNIALLDARKGVEMFKKVNIPCFGIIENMATHVCSSCGHKEAIFGEEGGQKIAAEYEVPQLGSLPLDVRIRKGLDQGEPIVVAEPESVIAADYRAIARRLSLEVYLAGASQAAAAPEIIMSND